MQVLIDGREEPVHGDSLAETVSQLRSNLRSRDRWICDLRTYGDPCRLLEVRTAGIAETVTPIRARLAELAEDGEVLQVAACVALGEAPEEAATAVAEALGWWEVVVDALGVLVELTGDTAAGVLLEEIAGKLGAAAAAGSAEELLAAMEGLAEVAGKVGSVSYAARLD